MKQGTQVTTTVTTYLQYNKQTVSSVVLTRSCYYASKSLPDC